MKNKIIALMAVIPLIILFTIMTLTSSVSVAISIPVSGVVISTPTTDGVLTLDMAEYMNDKYLQVEVLPYGAANRKYKLEFSSVEGSERGEVRITDDGLIVPEKTGTVKITAVTNDGGFRDSIIVNVISTKALGVTMSAYSVDGTSEQYEFSPCAEAGIDLQVTVETGRVQFEAASFPPQVSADIRYSVTPLGGASAEGFDIRPITGLADLRLSGEYLLTVTAQPAVQGYETALIKVTVVPSGDFTVDGCHSWEGAEGRSEKYVSEGAENTVLYVESDAPVSVYGELPEGIADVETTALGENQSALKVIFSSPAQIGEEFEISLVSGDKIHTVKIVCVESVTELSAKHVYDGVFIQKAGSEMTYAALTEPADDALTYRFEASGCITVVSQNGSECKVLATEEGEGVLRVYTVKDGEETLADTRTVKVVEGVAGLTFTDNAVTWGLGGVLAQGGKEYGENGILRDASALVGLQTVSASGVVSADVSDDIEFIVSDPSLAEIVVSDGRAYLVAKGTGRVTVTARWKYTTAFNDNVKASLTVDCVADGINVYTYEDLVKATESGSPVVLKADVMIGENLVNEDGSLVAGAAEKLQSYVKQLPTTADWTYYANTGQAQPTVNYCIEFKNDVFGNGFEINAENVTRVTPEVSANASVFDGPLYFVSAGGVASVMAQDNIVFLVRTDGIVVDNVVLKGCKDDSLYKDGKFELSYLNYTGTTLEIMADCRVINSRISNGRTVVRVFGRDGIDLKNTAVNPEKEKIEASIESCIISNGREFLVKLGTNRKVVGQFVQSGGSSTDYDTEKMAPSLVADGITFAPRNDDNLNDKTFTDNFLLTDVTLENSALYNSGLFAIGFESCFAGPMLDGGAISLAGWKGIGGTSYSAVLHMKGDVRIYDWKSLDYVDSSTLIEVIGTGESTAFLQLNIKQMLIKVRDFGGEQFKNLIYTADDGEFVHGGIAFYGGGKNYHMIDFSEFDGEAMTEYTVNLNVLAKGEESGSLLYLQGTMLPLAAGKEDFRFFMYDAASEFGYNRQQELLANGTAYDFVTAANHWN